MLKRRVLSIILVCVFALCLLPAIPALAAGDAAKTNSIGEKYATQKPILPDASPDITSSIKNTTPESSTYEGLGAISSYKKAASGLRGSVSAKSKAISGKASARINTFDYSNYYSFGVKSDGTVVIFYYAGSSKNVTTPKTLKGKKVTEIDEQAFATNPYLETLTISSGVKKIGFAVAAACPRLKKVVLPSTLTSMGTHAFAENPQLYSVNIPKYIKTIPKYTFAICPKLTKFTVPSTATTISEGAFYKTGLSSLTLSSGVKTIGKFAFEQCNSLKYVSIPKTVTTIDEGAFALNSSLYSVTLNSGLKTIGDSAFWSCPKLAKITIPSTVTTIGPYAFNENKVLASVTLSKGLKTIGKYAFALCPKLTKIVVPSTVTTISEGAFCDTLTLASVTLYGGLKTIGKYAFSECPKLTKITVPSTVTSIGDYAFAENPALYSVTLYSGLKTIGNSAFWSCPKLTKITIPSTVTSIGSYAFNENPALASVTLSKGLKTIGKYAFALCPKLTKIVIPSTVTDIYEGAFCENPALASVTLYSGLKTIGKYAFAGCTKLAKMTIPATVTTIGDYAFCENSALTSITLYSGLKTIGNYAISYCPKLTKISVPATVTTIGSHAFVADTSITSITLANGIQKIGDCAFSTCIALKSISFPASVTSIGKSVLINDAVLQSISVDPANTKYTVYNGALMDKACLNLMAYPAGKTSEEFVAPASLRKIEYAAVSNNPSLKKVTLLSGVVSMDSAAFGACINLESIYVPNSVTSMHAETFKFSPNVTIYAREGSYAHTFAQNAAIPFVDTAVPAQGIQMSKTSATIISGSTTQLHTLLEPIAANNTVTWSSSDTNVATVSSSGLVTGKKVGYATINAEIDGFTAQCLIKVMPTKVTNFKLSTRTTTSLKLIWDKKTDVAGYDIYQYNSSTKAYTRVKSVAAPANTYTATGLKPGATYTYKIVAYGVINEEVYPSEGVTLTTATTPSTPSMKSATKKTTTSIAVSWYGVSYAKGYEVYRATSKTGTYSKIATTSSTTYTNSKLSKGKTYYYKVKAYTLVGSTKIYSALSSSYKYAKL